MFGDTAKNIIYYKDTSDDYTKQLDFYEIRGLETIHIDSNCCPPGGRDVTSQIGSTKKYKNENNSWWFRSPNYSSSSSSYTKAYYDGNVSTFSCASASDDGGISIAFRIS